MADKISKILAACEVISLCSGTKGRIELTQATMPSVDPKALTTTVEGYSCKVYADYSGNDSRSATLLCTTTGITPGAAVDAAHDSVVASIKTYAASAAAVLTQMTSKT